MYAEIILPLALYDTYTYHVPAEMEMHLQTGSRVLVQFGKKKFYTGIVDSVHNNAPEYEVKEITTLLDSEPILRYPQLNLWRWISEYYLCTPGEVMRAALPTGLKPESETYISLNEDYEPVPGYRLTDRQAIIIQQLQNKGRMRISDIEAETGFKNCTATVQQMLDAQLVHIDERLAEKYHSKKETFVSICLERGDNEGLHRYFDMVRRSRQQEKTLIAYLDMSGWLHPSEKVQDVTRQTILAAAGVTPSVLKGLIDKGILQIEKRAVNRFNTPSYHDQINLSPLSASQQKALSEIKESFRNTPTVLLHGVTGSGKTEIYTHLISAALRDGSQVLYLVPEISLTTQLTDRLRKVFGNKLLVYHSKFSDSERVDIWKKLLDDGAPAVILGARSAVFLPFTRLGLVIVDEEHESSFKQYDPAPRYNGRDTSLMLAAMHGAKALLGSATPSVETYYKALNGKYGLVSLTERFEGSTLPDVEIVDMREQRKKKLNKGILSEPLVKATKHTLNAKKQAILFQNRRGFAPVVVCNQCGWTPKCENCDVSLVYHKKINLLKCHYCGFSRQLPTVCPACGQNSIEVFGYGTERIAEEVQKIFPDSGVTRMDVDTTRNKDAYQEIIERFANHETDILVGTQMVTKGLDFERVNTVGVINADTLLNFPDFRSNERAFNMLEQVAGRAGRRKDKGNVIIQTTKPDDKVLDHIKKHDYRGYYENEIKERRQYAYPPFTKVINIYLRSKDAMMAERAAVRYALKLREIFGTRVLGPEKPFVSRVALWYIQGIMLKVEATASMKKVKKILRDIFIEAAGWPEMKSTQIYYDVDPA